MNSCTTMSTDTATGEVQTAKQMPQFAQLADQALIGLCASLEYDREKLNAAIDEQLTPARREIETRLRQRRAENPESTGVIAIPHPMIRVELEPQYGPHAWDIPKLERAAAQLPDEERVKIVRRIPEQVTIVPAHVEAGHPASIKAAIKKYAGTEVADLLEGASQRPRLEDKLTIAPIRTALPVRRAR